MSVPTFVVSTGRCGSTMLSNMLREHPKVLSLSEFFGFVDEGSRGTECFPPGSIDGPQFWDIVAAVNRFSRFAYRHGVPCSEQLYPLDKPGFRFGSTTGVPGILVTTLPHLSDDPDSLFDVLQYEVLKWPMASVGQHYRQLFGFLAERFNRQLWVERTGSSLRMAGQLLTTFPEARFVHLVRDGRDTAISMQGHELIRVGFVMGLLEQCLGVDPISSSDRTRIDQVPEDLRPFLPESFDAEAFRNFRVPLSLCAQLWSQWISDGPKLMAALPADRLLTLRYEDLLAEPKSQLDLFAAFLGDDFVDEDWSQQCAATVRTPRSSWRDLPDEEVRTLSEACRPGFERLREMGVDYEFYRTSG